MNLDFDKAIAIEGRANGYFLCIYKNSWNKKKTLAVLSLQEAVFNRFRVKICLLVY